MAKVKTFKAEANYGATRRSWEYGARDWSDALGKAQDWASSDPGIPAGTAIYVSKLSTARLAGIKR